MSNADLSLAAALPVLKPSAVVSYKIGDYSIGTPNTWDFPDANVAGLSKLDLRVAVLGTEAEMIRLRVELDAWLMRHVPVQAEADGIAD